MLYACAWLWYFFAANDYEIIKAYVHFKAIAVREKPTMFPCCKAFVLRVKYWPLFAVSISELNKIIFSFMSQFVK